MADDKQLNLLEESEEFIIASLLYRPQLVMEELNRFNLTDKDFLMPKAVFLLKAAFDLKKQNKIYPTITDFLNYVPKEAKIRFQEYIKYLNGKINIFKNNETDIAFEEYLHAQLKLIKARKLKQELTDAVGQEDIEKIINRIDRIAGEWRLLKEEKKIFTIEEIGEKVIEEIQEIKKNYENKAEIKEEDKGITLGYNILDKNIGQVQPGEIIVIAGRPGMGKSVVLTNIARHILKNCQKKMAIISLEMKPHTFFRRLVVAEAQIPLWKFRKPWELTESDINRLILAYKKIKDLGLIIVDANGMNIREIEAVCRQLHKEGVNIFGVDYLQLITMPGGKYPKDPADYSQLSMSIRQLALELNSVFLVLSQLSRDVEKREDKKPTMADLSNTGQLERDAHVIVLLYRDEVYNKDKSEKPGTLTMMIAKNREGTPDEGDVFFMGEFQLIVNIA